MKRHSALFIILWATLFSATAGEVKIKIRHQYLNFPISHSVERKPLLMQVSGGGECCPDIRLAEDEVDYWVFQDVSLWKGKTITLSGDFSEATLARIYHADTLADTSQLYHEAQRPQYHFTTRRGWINDPNGCIYLNGRYHLFYQHNPYERDWGNMHWGHAVSTDLLHWQELPLALHPDHLGTMFSGTAIFDYANTAGLKRPALVAFYTADGQWETQCMAYSYDEGLTFSKYEGNPVVDSHKRWQSHDTRDPKVFRYGGDKGHWVMVVNERNGNTIYNSTDLKHWTPMSHIEGFWECPELFELPVIGEGQETHWVMWGASGTYQIGQFDGMTFTPETPKLCNLGGSAYAAQTFANMPSADGRVIKMAWGRITFDQMPFNGCMLLPQEQTLRRTSQGLRLYSYPVREVESLFAPSLEADNLSADEANRLLQLYHDDDVLHMKVTLHLTYATDAGISYRGQRLLSYDLNGNRLNGEFYATDAHEPLDITADIYVDRSVVEVYIDEGAFSCSMKRDGHGDQGYEIWGNQVQVKHLEIRKMASIMRGHEHHKK